MAIIGINFFSTFPGKNDWNNFIIGVVFFSTGFMIEKFVLK